MHPDYLIIGYGDIARRVTKLVAEQEGRVAVVSRRVSPGEEVSMPLQADLDLPQSLVVIPTAAARILYLAPPPDAGLVDSRIRNFCTELTQRLPQRPEKIVYISTSGVYGDCAGETVDETRAVNPQTTRAHRRVDAETVLHQWGALHRVPVVILRVAGIYGPDRLPLQRLRGGMPVLLPKQSPFSNRIHSDDLARICLAALDRVDTQGVYNVSDGEEGRMSDYFLAVARIFNLPTPALISFQEAKKRFTPEMLSYLSESRRLNNRRLLEGLKIELLYPTLESGLESIRQQGEGISSDS